MVIHLVEESQLPLAKVLHGVTELFPDFKPDLTTVTPQIPTKFHELSDYQLEMYAYSRSVGLSIEEASHTASTSYTLLYRLLKGHDISLTNFVKLIKAELFAVAEMKRKHLSNLDDASDGNVKATIAFLEKVYPEKYSPKAIVDSHIHNDQDDQWKVEITHVNKIVKQEGTAATKTPSVKTKIKKAKSKDTTEKNAGTL